MGERRLVVLAEVQKAEQRVEVDRHVGRPDHALDARRPLGRGSIDPTQAGVVVRAAQNLEVQQALEGMVVEIARAAGDMTQDVLAPGRLADLVQVVVALVGKDFLAELEHALSFVYTPSRAPGAPSRRQGWHR